MTAVQHAAESLLSLLLLKRCSVPYSAGKLQAAVTDYGSHSDG